MSANYAAIDELVEEFLKMELISVPPYPGQLGYLGSTKVNGTPRTLAIERDGERTGKTSWFGLVEEADETAGRERLESELRIAKRQHLACTEVLLPADLLPRISSEMFEQSEKEPCGIRGCTIYIEFEDEPDNTRRIATMKTDPNTVSTFELYLTLKQDRRGWISILPQFLKNLTRPSTIMISPEFRLTKNKLYHAYSD
uniref:Uncharacterized protein n=1 Tax=Anopheles culicifacies TaxID=139723 RepID=A0A182MHR4_9DIPT